MPELTLADIEGKVEETEVEAVDGDNQPEEEVQEEVQEEEPTDEQSGDDDSDDAKEEESKEEDPKPKKKENHDERRWKRILQERAEYKAKAELYEKQFNQPKQEEQQEGGRPSRADYDNDEDYVDSLTTWKVEQKLAGVRQELTQEQMQSQAQASWGSKVDQARTDYADYDTVMEDAQDIPVTPAVVEALQSSEIGADVAYYLAKHPEKAERLNTLPPLSQVREIGRIEALVEGNKSGAQKKSVSKAPAPIKPVRNTASKGTGKKSLDDMSPSEYMAYRNKQEQSRGRRR